ncbi:NADH dehydrogenase [ubiquinone] 1 subunit C2 [Rhinatrema bivittatum]|uniref:NADH dehydrogenase [ubiquinone] 1 subunit C2 n=1 Tax=Rhinatrema bivittatum TaxID=194408 RepID=UPI001128D5E2|nr:NADH dehydrogenase [ubiquinone] 1 subunit C2 [Rhinatrema bivittatum]
MCKGGKREPVEPFSPASAGWFARCTGYVGLTVRRSSLVLEASGLLLSPAMGLLPDEARGLPPPGIVNRNSVWVGFMGWLTVLLDNALNRRPPLRAGVHRQLLLTSAGWFLGYHLTKRENYINAREDTDLIGYMKLHPEDFKEPEKKTYAEVLEDFHPIR